MSDQRIEVTRNTNDEGTERMLWVFDLVSNRLSLSRFGIQRRKTNRGKWAKPTANERWESFDERQYNSGLIRPDAIPADVVDEARSQIVQPDVFVAYHDALFFDSETDTYRKDTPQ